MTLSISSLFTPALLRIHSFVLFAVHETRRIFLSPFVANASSRVSSFFLSSAKTDEPIEMPFGFWTRLGPGNHILDGGPDPPEERAIWGLFPSLKCIKLCKQKTPQQHGVADLSTGDSAWRPMRGFRMDSPAAGGDKCGGDASFRQNSFTTCR